MQKKAEGGNVRWTFPRFESSCIDFLLGAGKCLEKVFPALFYFKYEIMLAGAFDTGWIAGSLIGY